ncbi:DNA polymerase I [Actinomarinicola tropica]|uniref:DNA polymerase I n=1 Tax=Actinomarinicola tropica TaxID=2789776 RepID=A0A5Q2RIY3_9ACTN|nr:DNA polymerase I [Actinomarinicola tropica]QGG95484.1 DNA polymerase I [Actinomarinicola tropica]
MARLMLLDGNSLTYRAFFALPTDLTTASGQVTNAVYGFTSMLVNLVRDHRPDGVVVAFDRPEPTFRHEAVPDYKGTREAAPDILRQQMGLVRQVLEVLDLPIVEMPGFEADDIIASLATAARDRGDDVLIVTGDRDTYQLVEDPHVKVLYNKRGVSDYALYDEAGILERTGVRPVDYVQYAALRGDPSDNLPGVPGVGEKTAAKLVNTYGGLDGIFEALDAQTPKLRENLAANEAQVRSNAEVMVLRRDLEIDVEPRPLSSERVDPEALRQLIDFLEFHSLVERLQEAMGAEPAPTDGGGGLDVLVAEVDELDGPAAVRALDALARADGPVGVAAGWRGTPSWRDASWGAPGRSPINGLAVVTDPASGATAWVPATVLVEPDVVAALGRFVGDGGPGIVAHDAKPLLRALAGLGVDVRTLRLDTMLAAYLLDPAEARYLLEDLLGRHCRLRLPEESPAEEGRLDLGGGEVDDAASAACRALAVSRLVEPIEAALDAQGLRRLHDEIEVPLVRVLARMESVGIGVDVDVLRRLHRDLTAEAAELTHAVHEDAGGEFNVNSTKQLREVLFDRLGLTPQKKTKTGYSTDAASLEKLQGQHPIIDHLLRYREVEKLRSTYGEGLLAEVAPDGRIHATFNQTVARTGRLSSDAPNLHNIPVRTKQGREFRRAFVPGTGFELLVADYNQIELRCIAHLAEDPGLIAAFESGQDIHNATASRVFGVEPTAVTIEQRSKAKMVSYGLAYGMEAYGLGQRLNIPTEEAAVILDAYFVAFPAVKDYMERTVEEARQRGYTETLFGRRRQIPELASSNFRIRQAGERQAMNAGIQGLAADIFKVALVRLDDALEARGSRSRIVLQVHDEVLLEVDPTEHDAVADLTVATMADAFDLRVPLEVNLSFGDSWADAKG